MAELMDGITIDYTYSGGLRFVATFRDGRASYRAVGDTGGVADQNDDIPYRSRDLGHGMIHTVWHEEDVGDMVSLVINLEARRINSAAILGYPEADRMVHFEDGKITSIEREE